MPVSYREPATGSIVTDMDRIEALRAALRRIASGWTSVASINMAREALYDDDQAAKAQDEQQTAQALDDFAACVPADERAFGWNADGSFILEARRG